MHNHIPRNESAEFFTRERCRIKELLNDPRSPELSIARCRVEPGVTTELHSLTDTCETYMIEAGSGLMDDGGAPGRQVGPGDCISIAPGHPQRIRNTGQNDLVFLVICTPRFVPQCYVALEG